ncbi:MAG: MotA/TolQ/ExbB proton channel family protein [Bacteroidota bacterium]
MTLFMQGDPIFMGILTLILLITIALAVYHGLGLSKAQEVDMLVWKSKIDLVKSVGLFGLIFGIFSQLLGLYGAFAAIHEWGKVSPGILAAGIKTSMITTIYGVLIGLLGYGLWFGLQSSLRQKAHKL